MHIGFTGTRNGMSQDQKDALETGLLVQFCTYETNYFHHGDCIGADKEAVDIAKAIGYKIVCHPPIDSSKRAFCKYDIVRPAYEYLERNRDIVIETDYLIAAPKSNIEELRSGTWYTIRYANKMKKLVTILER